MDLLFWVYLANAVILINHEIDSAYWQEWKLLKPDERNGINGFLILHVPILFIVLIGLVLVYDQKFAGLFFSLFLSLSGLYAFIFHVYYLRKGRPEFNTVVSKTLIISTFVLSVFQIILTLSEMVI